jgi:ferredoxin, 2Fe-2S
MPGVVFILPDGNVRSAEIEDGFTLMEGAREEDIPGIIAECGGGQTCGTCHVIIEPEWHERVGPPSASEAALLDVAPESNERSRLSCQITIHQGLDRLVVRVPSSQIQG